ncbi:flavodoxin domain-containing protein [Vibrio sp. HN007]|uniref:flavodoxin domain-containing protein n=1 Tax=Vibrio iocasae TaxID=3098914 RepID=UPI0035D4EBDD
MKSLKHLLMSILFTPVYEDKYLLICYASQTGTAMHLANESVKLANAAGINADVKAMDRLTPEDLSQYQLTLMIVSTCGEGDIPDNGKAFYQALERHHTLTAQVRVLALGDKSYQQFCLAGKQFHKELCRIGVSTREDLTLASGNPTEIWKNWLDSQLNNSLDLREITASDTKHKIRLTEKRHLHNIDHSDSGEAYELIFDLIKSSNSHFPGYEVNSLVAITPPESDKPRLYSVASSPGGKPSQIKLCVARHQFILDGEWHDGLCSQYLTRQLANGDELDVDIRAGGGLSLPEQDKPLILIATGAGIAPMMSMLEERSYRKHTGRNWMIFGNRYSEGDYYYQDQLEQFLREGVLEQLDTAFSHDGENKCYVQDVLAKESEKLSTWLLEDDCHIYVCGRPELKAAISETIKSTVNQLLDNPVEADEMYREIIQSQVTFELY